MDSPNLELKSCGFLIFRRLPPVETAVVAGKSFLLMRHADRWDLPKGHVDRGESESETALRELVEETGISASDIKVDNQFRFEHVYPVRLKRFNNKPNNKTLVVFLAELLHPVNMQLTEHEGFKWFPWKPPHTIQSMTIDPLLESVARHWACQKS